MCTLILFVRTLVGTPLLLAANRDEQLDRPAAPPSLRAVSGVRVLAPTDRLAGGTWLGVSEHGVVAGITNRFGVPRDPARRSRGQVVLEALSAPSALSAAEAAARLDPSSYNGFHLVVADRDQAHLVCGDGARVTRRALEPGVHVVTERSLGAAPTERAHLILERLGALGLLDPGAVFDARARAGLQALLAAHQDDAFEGVCVHLPGLSYGTRSSTLLALGESRSEVRYEHAEGAPCRVPHAAVSLAWG